MVSRLTGYGPWLPYATADLPDIAYPIVSRVSTISDSLRYISKMHDRDPVSENRSFISSDTERESCCGKSIFVQNLLILPRYWISNPHRQLLEKERLSKHIQNTRRMSIASTALLLPTALTLADQQLKIHNNNTSKPPHLRTNTQHTTLTSPLHTHHIPVRSHPISHMRPHKAIILIHILPIRRPRTRITHTAPMHHRQ